jgi:hypothetical protein
MGDSNKVKVVPCAHVFYNTLTVPDLRWWVIYVNETDFVDIKQLNYRIL